MADKLPISKEYFLQGMNGGYFMTMLIAKIVDWSGWISTANPEDGERKIMLLITALLFILTF